MAIDLTLPDGSHQAHPDGVTGWDVAAAIGPRLAEAAVAVRLDGEPLDLGRVLPGGGRFEVITDGSDEGRAVIRHSAAHVLAQAVLDLFDGAHFAIGPAIQDGFYYDFDVGRPFTPEDLERVEERMRQIVAEDQPFVRQELTRKEGVQLFAGQPFKIEIIEAVEETEVGGGDVVSVYRNDGFVDLCRGPHLPSTGRIPAFKLLRSAGAYWRGDERRQQLQRIYGTAWESKQALDEHLAQAAEAERRDHRRVGPDLELFSFPRELGAGLVLWHPKGSVMRTLIEDYSRDLHARFGFDAVFTPHLARSELWQISGHLDYYRENMFPGMVTEEGEYRAKPMNCPFHVLIYRSKGRSYRELPVRLSELGSVYRHERSGVLHGMLRARGFTQDDSHTFCRRDQLDTELSLHLDFVLTWLRAFGFDEFEADLSTRDPEKAMGSLDLWDQATDSLRATLEHFGLPYRVAEAEAAYYGPKIDVHVKDAIGRRWQLSTIQLDFFLPERFDLEYISAENRPERPVMIHCAKAGSIERFFGVLVEHYAGVFPIWLAPVQATVVSVADRHLEYASEVARSLGQQGLRVEVDRSDDTVGEKIRRALTAHHPAVLVVGDRDVEAGTVGLRLRGDEHERRGVALADAADELAELAAPPQA